MAGQAGGGGSVPVASAMTLEPRKQRGRLEPQGRWGGAWPGALGPVASMCPLLWWTQCPLHGTRQQPHPAGSRVGGEGAGSELLTRLVFVGFSSTPLGRNFQTHSEVERMAQ